MASDELSNPFGPPWPETNPFEDSAPGPTWKSRTPSLQPWGPWATLGWTFLILVGTFVVQLVLIVVYIATIGMDRLQEVAADLPKNGLVLVLVTLLSAPFAIGFTVLVILLRRQSIRDYLALTWPPRRQVWIALAGLALLLPASDFVTYLLGRPIVSDFTIQAYRTSPLVPLLLVVLVAAPIWEEVLMRGFLFQGIGWRWGPPAAVLISALVFASLHLQYDLYGIAQIMVMGIYLGVVRQLTGSTLTTIVLHFFANVFATLELVLWLNWPG